MHLHSSNVIHCSYSHSLYSHSIGYPGEWVVYDINLYVTHIANQCIACNECWNESVFVNQKRLY